MRCAMFGLVPYMVRLCDAFGWRYVVSCVLAYGINQGVGEKFVFGARSYFMLDEIGMDSAAYGRIAGFSHIPWQLKSLFGLLSDTVPIHGRHRSPYMLIAGALGCMALSALALLPTPLLSPMSIGLLLLLVNVNFAMPDVMIDATVAERSKRHPALGAELQALCWGSLGLFGLPAGLLKGLLLIWSGPRLLFGLSIVAAFAVTLPPLLGWLDEPKREHISARALCRDVWTHRTKRVVARSALLVGLYSVVLGVVQATWAATHPAASELLLLLGNASLCGSLYMWLRTVDETLARAAAYTFLKGRHMHGHTRMCMHVCLTRAAAYPFLKGTTPRKKREPHQPWAPCDPHAHQPWAPCDPHAHQPWAPCDPHAHQLWAPV